MLIDNPSYLPGGQGAGRERAFQPLRLSSSFASTEVAVSWRTMFAIRIGATPGMELSHRLLVRESSQKRLCLV